MPKSQTPTPAPAPAGAQHRYSTRKQKAALEAFDALISDPESRSLSQTPTTNQGLADTTQSAFVAEVGDGAGTRTMADILGSVNLLLCSRMARW